MAGHKDDTTEPDVNRDVVAKLEIMIARLNENTQNLAQLEAENAKLREENTS